MNTQLYVICGVILLRYILVIIYSKADTPDTAPLTMRSKEDAPRQFRPYSWIFDFKKSTLAHSQRRCKIRPFAIRLIS